MENTVEKIEKREIECVTSGAYVSFIELYS